MSGDRNQLSPTLGEPRQPLAPTLQRVPSTTAGRGHARRQLTVAEEEGEITLSEVSEFHEDTDDDLLKAFKRMGIKSPKHFDPKRD
jgi:hypothetical protein